MKQKVIKWKKYISKARIQINCSYKIKFIMLISKYRMQKIAPEDNKKIISPLKKSKII